MVEQSQWMTKVQGDPSHSSWYVERFRTMAAEGKDLGGEARMIDAMIGRESHILDAGCGPGRVGAILHRAGHTVVGVDVDPVLIAAAEEDHPGPTWLVGDLAELDLTQHGISQPFDAIVCAGNVATFLAASTRVATWTRLGKHLAPDGRLVIGFGMGRGYELDDFRSDVAAAKLTIDLELESWELHPATSKSEFLVAIIRHPSRTNLL